MAPAVGIPGAGPFTWPVTLEDERIRLEPLAFTHVPDLTLAAQDDELWRWMPVTRPRDEAAMRAIVAAALDEAAAGRRHPFAIVARDSGRAVGSTSYLDLAPEHRALEIGWTWLARDRWRTPLNTACKLLLLRHAFEERACNRVSLKTDGRNRRSQRAIERIGGVREGTLRQHRIRPDGTVRDTVYFSIVADEWPAVRERLHATLAG